MTYERGNDTFTIAQDHDKRSITHGTSMSIVTPARSVDCTDIDTKPVCLEVPEGVSSLVSVGLLFYDNVAQGLAAAADAVPPIATTVEARRRTPSRVRRGRHRRRFSRTLSGTLGSLPNQQVRVCVDVATGYLLEYSSERRPEPIN